MNLFRTSLRFTLFALLSSAAIQAYAPTNFYRPYDVDFRLYEWKHSNFRAGASFEHGSTHNARDWDEKKRNVMQRYAASESSIAMLLGAPVNSTIYTLANDLGVSSGTITDDGIRGNFILDGKYEETDCVLFAKYKLPINLAGTFELALFVPLKKMEFKNVKWEDQTQDVLAADLQFKNDFTSKLGLKTKELGNLDIDENGWKKSGLGDLVLMLSWQRDFKQEKEYLKNVRLNLQLGLSMPTGAQQDLNHSLALPLGNDGAWGVPINIGLDLDFVHQLRAGLEFEMLPMFDHTSNYRMKTNINQTDYLLLNVGEATKSQGTAWQFHLFAQAKEFLRYFSAMMSYEFLKHDDDHLSPKSYDFSYGTVNSAQSLEEWNVHNFVFELGCDPCGKATKKNCKPHISAFCKLPITGKHVITATTFGGQIACSF